MRLRAIFLLSTLVVGHVGLRAEPRAMVLTEVKKSAVVDQQWAQNLCQAAALQSCAVHVSSSSDPALQPKLYRAQTDQPNHFYAIFPGPHLVQAEFQAERQTWRVLAHWNLADYQPARSPQGDGAALPMTLYPALYPLGPERFAVAVVSAWNEMSAGGGGSWQLADFVELKPQGQHAPQAYVAGMPFSCTKSIRACFSATDYKRSAHCSDDSSGTLSLRFAPAAGAGSDLYTWTASWKETQWPAHQPKRKATTRVTTVPATSPQAAGELANALLNKIPFCQPTALD